MAEALEGNLLGALGRRDSRGLQQRLDVGSEGAQAGAEHLAALVEGERHDLGEDAGVGGEARRGKRVEVDDGARDLRRPG